MVENNNSLSLAMAAAPKVKQHREKQSFTTVVSLVTTLLTDLQRTYVIDSTKKDKKMRKRIQKSIEIINSYQEM